MGIQSCRDLNVWQEAMSIAEQVYRLAAAFPSDERFGLSVQMRRAAVSIAANIAEGHGRETSRYYVQFLRVSQGSLKELETHLFLSQRVGLTDRQQAEPVLDECDKLGRMLRSLIRAIQESRGRMTNPIPHSLFPTR
ncbi:four helix bundle protein [Terricaulis sp.]|uniref:four helix bundle protein n=1 Tax=Terricaulis sp. TaxID=2768686 RepID=UPI003783EE32